MRPQTVKTVCFSPTNTTKTIVDSIARRFVDANIESIDLTRPAMRTSRLTLSRSDLLIIGVPVYMGRVPAVVRDWIMGIKADNTPVVCVAVYGNRAYDDALLELTDMVTECGCVTLAAAAVIAEHSFAGKELPTALGRPDSDDLKQLSLFADRIIDKLSDMNSVNSLPVLSIPGNHPYGGVTDLWDVDFIEVDQSCNSCGVCVSACPVNAIDRVDQSKIDIKECITCCACIKSCPQHARSIKDSKVNEAANRLYNMFSEPKQPEFFI